MKIWDKLTPWWNTFLNLIYPTICTCIVCERALPEEYLQRRNLTEIPESRLWLCDICQHKAQPILDLGCVVCGRIRVQYQSINTTYRYNNQKYSNSIKMKMDSHNHADEHSPTHVNKNGLTQVNIQENTPFHEPFQQSHHEPFQHLHSHRHQSPLDNQICNECQSHERPFVFARAAVRYSGVAKDLIRILKFESNKLAATWLGEWLCQAWVRHYAGLPIDLIIPVPLHQERLQQRGFNQAVVLAQKLSEYSKIPVLEPLQRIQTRSSQASRNRMERLQSLESAFQCEKSCYDRLSGANVLLVDDVFTTGATAEACTNELLRAGCKDVWVLTVAR